MTTEEFLLILATIYIAPHLPPAQGYITGGVLFMAAACKSLGLI